MTGCGLVFRRSAVGPFSQTRIRRPYQAPGAGAAEAVIHFDDGHGGPEANGTPACPV